MEQFEAFRSRAEHFSTAMLERCDLLRKDLAREQKAKPPNSDLWAVDYCELFRYLYPLLDKDQPYRRVDFAAVFTAIVYVFERFGQSRKLVLLPPYVEELQGHFLDIRSRLSGGPAVERSQWGQELQRTKLRIDMERSLEALDLEDPSNESTEDLWRLVVAGDWIFFVEDFWRDLVRGGFKKFQNLVRNGTLAFYHDIPELSMVKQDDILRLKSHFLAAINKQAPERQKSNARDAEALSMIQLVNEKLSEENRRILLFTGSKKLLACRKYFRDHETIKPHLTEIRDLKYFLVRFFLDVQEEGNYEDRLNEYYDLLSGFQRRSKQLSEGTGGPGSLAANQQEIERANEKLTDLFNVWFGFAPEAGDVGFRSIIEELGASQYKDGINLIQKAFRSISTIRRYLESPEEYRKQVSALITELDNALVELDGIVSKRTCGLPPG